MISGGRAGWEPVAQAASRWVIWRAWAIPLWMVAPVVGGPALLVILSHNVVWLFTIPLLVRLVRAIWGDDQNRARIVWLGITSGQTFADRAEWGGATRDPLDA